MTGSCVVPGDSPRYEREGSESDEQAAKPRESVGAEQQVHGIREKFGRRFEQMVQLRTNKTGQARKRNESFSFAGIFVGDSAAGQVCAKDEIRGEHGTGDHETERGNRDATNVKKRDHRQ